jgi:hypothetical protein
VKYLFLVCVDPTLPRDDQPDDINRWVDDAGTKRLDGAPLRPGRTAATVRVRGGDRVVTDGPFADTPEKIAGFDLIECESREEALDLAAAHPVASFGAIEVREIQD